MFNSQNGGLNLKFFKIPLFGKKGNAKKKDYSKTDVSILAANLYTFYPEDYFQDLIIMERKRSERSGKYFLLMLIDIRKFLQESKKKSEVKKLFEVIGQNSREIDVKGWYKLNQLIGILYLEIDIASKDVIVEKIKNTIRKSFSPQYADMIEVTFLVFPHEDGKEESAELTKTTFYNTKTKTAAAHRTAHALKRGIDVVGSLAGIILFSPILFIIAVLVKSTSKGPVFFTQLRVGQGGKTFMFYKFRSMHVNNDESIHKEFTKNFIRGSDINCNNNRNKLFKIKNDPRITKIGALIRKTSLDELPQLFNVLKGDMSLVGPRPPIPYEVEQYDIWHKRRILEIKPGITGVWQVNGRSITKFEEMVRMDIQYIKKWSIMLDLQLIVRTPISVIMTKGAC